MDIRFPIAKFPVGKTYSFASSPTESELLITFKKGVSKFKKALENVNPRDTMLITQCGSNGFLLSKNFKSLFIAGGIGITPFRSMLKDIVDTNTKMDIILIYQNHTQDFPFKNALEKWQKEYKNLKVVYIVTGIQGRLTKDKLQLYVPDILERRIYIAGPPGMVSNVETMLNSIGLDKISIMTDSFTGY